jgi:hypothetical protein
MINFMNNIIERSDYVRMYGDSNVIFRPERFEEF